MWCHLRSFAGATFDDVDTEVGQLLLKLCLQERSHDATSLISIPMPADQYHHVHNVRLLKMEFLTSMEMLQYTRISS